MSIITRHHHSRAPLPPGWRRQRMRSAAPARDGIQIRCLLIALATVLAGAVLGGAMTLPRAQSQEGESMPGAPPPQAPEGESDELLRVMSFNIRFGTANDGANAWPHRREMVFDLIRAKGGDVVGLQEALRFQIDEIIAACPDYAFVGVGRDDGRDAGEFAPILYRPDRWRLIEQGTFWFSDTPDAPGSTSWGNSIPRICTWALLAPVATDHAAGAFLIYNVHLDHRSENSRVRSAEAIVRRAVADRARLVEHGREWTASERPRDGEASAGLLPDLPWIPPVIVTGDFNAGEASEPIRIMKSGEWARSSDDEEEDDDPEGPHTPLHAETNDAEPGPDHREPRLRFLDTFRVLFPDASEVGTFSGFKPDQVEGAKIDYVFVTPDIRVVNAEIDRTTSADGTRVPSDHFPVLATLRLPAAPISASDRQTTSP